MKIWNLIKIYLKIYGNGQNLLFHVHDSFSNVLFEEKL